MATYGLRQFDKIQVGQWEDPCGTAEVATEIFTGMISARPWDYKLKQDHYYSAGALIPRSAVPTVVQHQADFTYENDLDDREICWLMSSALRQRTGLHDENNSGATYYQTGTVLTNGSATFGITDTNTDLETAYEDDSGDSSYLLIAVDESDKWIWGHIRLIATSGNNYTFDIWDDISGSNQNWNGDQGTFAIAEAVTWDIFAVNTWSYLPAWTSTGNSPTDADGIRTFTWEMGNNELDGEIQYCFVRRLEISGRPDELCTVSADITGRQFLAAGAFTSLSSTGIVAREYFPFNLAKFYLGTWNTDWATTFGAVTQIYGVEEFSWVLETGFRPHFVPDGQYYFYDALEDPGIKKATLSLTLPVVSVTPAWDTAELPAALAGTARYIRIELFGTGGTREVQIDGKYTYTDFPEGDTDGLLTFACTLESAGQSVGKATVDQLDVVINSSMTAFP